MSKFPANNFVTHAVNNDAKAREIDFAGTLGSGTTGWHVVTAIGKMYANTIAAAHPDHRKF